MNYNCKICNFSTEKPSTWYSHLKSKKHILIKEHKNITKENVESVPDRELLKKEIESLKKELEYKDKLIEEKHKLIEEKDKLIEEKENKYTKIIEIMNKEHEKQIDMLSGNDKFHRGIINEAGGLIKDAMRSVSFVVANYKNAPTLVKSDYDDLRTDEKFIDELIYCNKKNIIDKKLGNIIIEKHKKKDPSQQSFWSTDTSRLNYIVKSNNEIDDKKKSKTIIKKGNDSEWIRDKGGVKITQLIIDPLLNNVKKINNEHINNSNKQIQNGDMDIDQQQPIVNKMLQLNEINVKIANDSLAKDINRFISPHFSL
ncbi:C2H2-type zinc finger [Catovirus CTV1]|uniref:C2H2-type zinc finger n=1 Tax=Catovirus CTV1 TaxID=1977631 RepID=A0A1V0S8T4_9VIRU|nr:C2H2-type zinc finger [Catovirus CTV1]